MLVETGPGPRELCVWFRGAQEGSHKLLLLTSLRARRARRRASRSKPKPSTYLVPTLEGRAREPLWAETWCGISQGQTPRRASMRSLIVGALLLIAAFIVGRKATRAAESEPLLATTA